MARELSRSRILLQTNERFTDEQTADSLHLGSAAAGRVHPRLVAVGFAGTFS